MPGKPATGTHVNIEGRALNGEAYSFAEAAGAMGWSLGTLDAEGGDNDSVSVTLAIMFGVGPIQKSCEQMQPAAHWGLDEGLNEEPGSIAHDYIGDNDGTLVGDPQWVTGEYIGGALEFDGDGDYVALSDPLGVLTGDSVTISAWVNPGQGMVNGKVYDVLSQTKGPIKDLYGYDLYIVVNAGLCKPGFSLRYIASSSGCFIGSGEAIPKDEWTWLVGTNDGDSLKLYVNAELKGSAVSTGRMGLHANAYIGYLPGDDPFIGMIDCVWAFACPWDPSHDCLPLCHEDYDEWFEFGRPDCWCYPRQCHGDADGLKQGDDFFGWTYVSTDDLNVLIDAWQILEPPHASAPYPNGISDVPNGICADFNHNAQGNDFFGWMRVSTDDLAVLVNAWQVLEPPKNDPMHPYYPFGIPGDCLLCDRGGQSDGSSSARSELSRTDMLDWLAQIWLDPDVRESIEAEAWLKLYQSLKE